MTKTLVFQFRALFKSLNEGNIFYLFLFLYSKIYIVWLNNYITTFSFLKIIKHYHLSFEKYRDELFKMGLLDQPYKLF